MTNVQDLLQKLDIYKKEYYAFKAKQEAEMLEAAHGLFAGLFESFPFVEAVVWTQYTPGFNDGEPCTFGVHDFYVMGEGYLDDEDVYGAYPEELEYVIQTEQPYNYTDWKSGKVVPDYAIEDNEKWETILNSYGATTMDELNEILNGITSLPDEIFESFGEGLVVASRKGIEVQEYDCGY